MRNFVVTPLQKGNCLLKYRPVTCLRKSEEHQISIAAGPRISVKEISRKNPKTIFLGEKEPEKDILGKMLSEN